jgi:hypothetical protein
MDLNNDSARDRKAHQERGSSGPYLLGSFYVFRWLLHDLVLA